MDEEDIKDRDESEQLVTTKGFAGFGTADDQHVRHALDDLFTLPEDSMGEKLLNRMGWKKGHGIGSRSLRKIDPSDPDSQLREFPPQDTPIIVWTRSNETRGLGYGMNEETLPRLSGSKSGTPNIDDQNALGARPGASFMDPITSKAKPKPKPRLGLASLEDVESDEDGAYDLGPKVSYNHVLGGDRKVPPSKGVSIPNANPLVQKKPTFVSRSKTKAKPLPGMLVSLRKCHDGKLPLSGFVLADELDGFSSMDLSDNKYAPPEVPGDWQPAQSAVFNSEIIPDVGGSILQQQTAASRRQALNEPALPSKSVFDFLSPAARDRLATATGNTNLPPALDESLSTSQDDVNTRSDNQPSLPYPPLSPTTATTALSRLRRDKTSDAPYATDLPKQGRYKDFLRYSSDSLPPSQRIPPLRPPHASHSKSAAESDAEHLEELTEFAATAGLFRPVTGFFASRFTTSTTAAAEGGDERSRAPADGDDGDGQTSLLSRPVPKLTDPGEEAAHMGMFGLMTRSVKGWMPTRLVCKRFEVAMPIDVD